MVTESSLSLVNREALNGRLAVDSAPFKRTCTRPEGSGQGSPGHRIIHFAAPDEKEGPSGTRTDRHLSEDERVPEAACRGTFETRGCATARGLEKASDSAAEAS